MNQEAELLFNCHKFCAKYEAVLRLLYEDPDLKEWCEHYSVYSRPTEHERIDILIYKEFMHEAYDMGIVINNYYDILKEGGLDEHKVYEPDAEFIAGLTKMQIIACIAYQFRADHFNNGSLMNHAVADGYMLKLIQGFKEKTGS